MPELRGLVLAGGLSRRMKRDKSLLVYKELGSDQEQRLRTLSLLQGAGLESYISCRSDQAMSLPKSVLRLLDSEVDSLGPATGLLRAHQEFPSSTWFVLACDLPWLSPLDVEHLLKNRDRFKAATLYQTQIGIEPLIAIWEPLALNTLAKNILKKQKSLQKNLQTLPLKLVNPLNEARLQNCNEPLTEIKPRP